MELKELHTADTIRHALAGHLLLTNEERYAAVVSSIKKVEASLARANCARSKGFHYTADLLDRLVDANMEEIDRLLALPTIQEDTTGDCAHEPL
jgi:hypothetical protein